MLGSLFPRIRDQVQTFAQDRLDRVGVLLSCLCLVHCVLGLVLVAGLGMGATFLLDPAIHKVGLLLATLVAGVAIGVGAVRHRRPGPFVVAMTGLSFMGAAVAVGHGYEEAVLTVIGVVLVAAGHILNLRKA
ncbi:MerC domain-containing protein [Alteraurantiacibacter palmitatis]|uniref:MerC domain-containing protein n=1 Tax=Alteraurantiacibacter palmitatis TaxID=2054628 RepID=A0ABV7E1G0_9SPHN